MTPQEKLRAAAKVLRETAAKATPGPWNASHITGIGRCVSDTTISICIAAEDGWVSKGDVSWIALANPQIAEPLAVWLEREARNGDYTLSEFGYRSISDEALAVARAILPADEAEETR